MPRARQTRFTVGLLVPHEKCLYFSGRLPWGPFIITDISFLHHRPILQKGGCTRRYSVLFWHVMHFYVKQIFWNVFTQNFITYVTALILVTKKEVDKIITVILGPSPQAHWQIINLEVLKAFHYRTFVLHTSNPMTVLEMKDQLKNAHQNKYSQMCFLVCLSTGLYSCWQS